MCALQHDFSTADADAVDDPLLHGGLYYYDGAGSLYGDVEVPDPLPQLPNPRVLAPVKDASGVFFFNGLYFFKFASNFS